MPSDADDGDRREDAGMNPPTSLPVGLSFHELPWAAMVCLLDDLDIAGVGQFTPALDDFVLHHEGLLVVDLGGHFVDLSGMMALVAASERAAALGRTLVVTGLPGVWDRALPALGLDERLRHEPDVPTALRVEGSATQRGTNGPE